MKSLNYSFVVTTQNVAVSLPRVHVDKQLTRCVVLYLVTHPLNSSAAAVRLIIFGRVYFVFFSKGLFPGGRRQSTFSKLYHVMRLCFQWQCYTRLLPKFGSTTRDTNYNRYSLCWNELGSQVQPHFLLWPWTLIYDLVLQTWLAKMYVKGHFVWKLVSGHRHTHTTDHLLYTATKVI